MTNDVWQLDQAVEDARALPRPEVQVARLETMRDMLSALVEYLEGVGPLKIEYTDRYAQPDASHRSEYIVVDGDGGPEWLFGRGATLAEALADFRLYFEREHPPR